MQTFTSNFDGTTTVSTYFDRQQGCQKLLRSTKEPILVATMIGTSLGHFQRLPYMSKACEDWEEFEQEMDDDDQLTTWTEFKKHFNKEFLTYEIQQETLQEAGIANSAIEKEEIQDLFDQRDSTVAALLAERNNKFEAHSQKFEALFSYDCRC